MGWTFCLYCIAFLNVCILSAKTKIAIYLIFHRYSINVQCMLIQRLLLVVWTWFNVRLIDLYLAYLTHILQSVFDHYWLLYAIWKLKLLEKHIQGDIFNLKFECLGVWFSENRPKCLSVLSKSFLRAVWYCKLYQKIP